MTSNVLPYDTFMPRIEAEINRISEMSAEEHGVPDVTYHVAAEERKALILQNVYWEFEEEFRENPAGIELRCYSQVIEELDQEIKNLTAEFGDIDILSDPHDRVLLDALLDLKFCMEKTS